MTSRRRRRSRKDAVFEPIDASRALSGWRRVETRRSHQWYVQPIPAERALKDYVCPGCGGPIPPGVTHVVTWRADGVLGDASDLEGRRHWHTTCWKAF